MTLHLPPDLAGLTLIASVSGGKDSTALMLALREAELPHLRVFADTGWEAPETYRYLDLLRERLGPIDVVGVEGGMRARAMYRASFPGRMQRWCTQELKIDPLRAYHDDVIARTGVETASCLGIRAAESESRSRMAEVEDEPTGPRLWGGWIWRPLLRWTIDDVIEIHKRHGVPMNPLYHQGFDRVGCFPCIFARKEEIRLLPDARIDEIEALEAQTTAERERRNAEHAASGAVEPRYTHPQASFFQTQRQGFDGIRAVRRWAQTERGGKQFPILPPLPTGGCMRWGICESPPPENER